MPKVYYKLKNCGKRAQRRYPFTVESMRKALVVYGNRYPATMKRMQDKYSVSHPPSRVTRPEACKYMRALQLASKKFVMPPKAEGPVCRKAYSRPCGLTCIRLKQKCHLPSGYYRVRKH